MVSRVNCVVAAVDVVSTTGAAPETVIVSSSEPTFSGDVDLGGEPDGQADALALDRLESRQRVLAPCRCRSAAG